MTNNYMYACILCHRKVDNFYIYIESWKNKNKHPRWKMYEKYELVVHIERSRNGS